MEPAKMPRIIRAFTRDPFLSAWLLIAAIMFCAAILNARYAEIDKAQREAAVMNWRAA